MSSTPSTGSAVVQAEVFKLEEQVAGMNLTVQGMKYSFIRRYVHCTVGIYCTVGYVQKRRNILYS